MVWMLVALSFWTHQIEVTVVGGPYRTLSECRAAGEGAERPLGVRLPLDMAMMTCWGTNSPLPK